jgi:hypothetical protein
MSCLFHSLSFFLKEDPFQIRQKICNYLQENKPIIDGIDTHQVLEYENKQYISNMRKPSTWGGAIEIQCACTIWNTNIIVSNHRDIGNRMIEFIPITGRSERTIRIYWTGGHYEPLR